MGHPRFAYKAMHELFCFLLSSCFGFFVLYFMKEMIIQLVFSDAFMGMSDYFIPQMIGDIFRTIAAGISFALMARGIVKISMVFELLPCPPAP